MAQSQLKSTELEFTSSSSSTGAISFNNSNEFECDRVMKLNESIATSQFTVGANSSVVVSEFTKYYARVRQASAPGSANFNTLRPVTYDTTDEVSNITVNTTNGTFTISKAGVYQVSFHIQADQFGSSDNHAFWVKVNSDSFSSSNLICAVDADNGTNNIGSMQGSCLINLNENDVISIYSGNLDGSSLSDSIDFPKNTWYAEVILI